MRNKENNKNKGVWKTGYIDFQVIGSEGNVDIKGYRSKWFDEFKKPQSALIADSASFEDIHNGFVNKRIVNLKNKTNYE